MGRGILRQRAIAALVAVLVQAGFVILLVQARMRDAPREENPPYMVLIPVLPEPAMPRDPRRPERAASRHGTLDAPYESPARESLELPIPRSLSEASKAISVPPAPPVDWYGQLAELARSAAGSSTETQDDPLKSTPQALELPPEPVERVTVHRLNTGEQIMETRINADQTVVCRQGVPLMAQFELFARAVPPSCFVKGEKKQPNFDSLKPRYLRRPLPVPDKTRAGDQP